MKSRVRVILLSMSFVLIVFLIFLSSRQGLSNQEMGSFQLLLFVAININIILLVFVFYQILRNLMRLFYERKDKSILGFNLKTKLIITFVILSLPATVFHLFASSLISSTFESWLTGQHQTTVDNAKYLQEVYEENIRVFMENQSELLENRLLNAGDQKQFPVILDQTLNTPLQVGISLYDSSHHLIFQHLPTPLVQQTWIPLSVEEWIKVDQMIHFWQIDQQKESFLYRKLRNFVFQQQNYTLEIFYPTSKKFTSAVEEIVGQEEKIQFLSNSKDLIDRYYLIIFAFMTLLIIFAATYSAYYLARGVVQPIEQLAAGTERVAAGELGYQIQAQDELSWDKDFGTLIQSFNLMSTELLESRVALENTTKNLRESNNTLEANTRFMELILERIQTGILSLDIEGRLNTLNPSARTLLQIKEGTYLHRHYSEIVEQESLELLNLMFEQLKTVGRNSVMQDLNILKENTPLHIACTLLNLKNRENQIVGHVVVLENITEMERYERVRAWREVARRVAHEIKNPLTPIQLSAERIRRKYLESIEEPQVLDRSVSIIIHEVEQMKKMVQEFSNFARLPESNLQMGHIHQVLEETMHLYAEGISDQITIQMQPGQNIPQFPLDKAQLRRVFINLIDNAIASMTAGKITLRTYYHQELQICVVEVEDTGTGISPYLLPRIFEPYTTTKDHGTGLGLTIVSQIVSDHKGYIRSQNIQPHGTLFTIEFPIDKK